MPSVFGNLDSDKIRPSQISDDKQQAYFPKLHSILKMKTVSICGSIQSRNSSACLAFCLWNCKLGTVSKLSYLNLVHILFLCDLGSIIMSTSLPPMQYASKLPLYSPIYFIPTYYGRFSKMWALCIRIKHSIFIIYKLKYAFLCLSIQRWHTSSIAHWFIDVNILLKDNLTASKGTHGG